MNREEEIKERASEYAQYEVWGSSYDDVECGFIDGAIWADEHPSYSFIVKVWNLATRTAIAQCNKEMPFFKSENEVKEYIKKHIRL